MLLAKKGGGKKGGGKKGGGKGGKKQSGFSWASNFELKPFEATALRELAEQGCRTYQTRTGKVLHPNLADAADVPKTLWTLPMAFLIVGRVAAPTDSANIDGAAAEGVAAEGAAVEGDVAEGAAAADAAPSTYLYANLAAVEALGFADWQTCIGSPAELVDAMPDRKYEGGYVKKLKERKEVTLRDASRWVIDKAAIEAGKLVTTPVGLCYAFAEWEDGEGMICEPGGKRRQPDLTPAELEAAVEAQATEVRRLKQEEGLSNSDPAVATAVAELLRLKAALEAAGAST